MYSLCNCFGRMYPDIVVTPVYRPGECSTVSRLVLYPSEVQTKLIRLLHGQKTGGGGEIDVCTGVHLMGLMG